MKVVIKFTNLDPTLAIKKYTEGKIGSVIKFLKKWEQEGEVEAQVELARRSYHHRKGDVFRVEVSINLPGKILRAVERDWNIRVAINKVKDKLKIEAAKYKELQKPKRIRKKN